ncbi:MAG TPA: hypothetical protein VM659_27680 [Dongiaceae bacterium]|nr:hypothetical protein [Dongiaceae bacterium]
MTEIHREFILRGRADWQEVVATVRAAGPAMAKRGTPLRLVLVDGAQDRLEEQVKFYWSAVIEPIAEQVWIGGRKFSAKAWHVEMKERFLPVHEMRMPDGTVRMVAPSIARGEITVGAMSEYTKKVAAHAASELGVQFD